MPIYLTVWRATGLDAAYRMAFEFWLKIFGLAFGLGVVDPRKMVGHGAGGS
jgi:cytochrome bd-type quinol oxidase subunit 1